MRAVRVEVIGPEKHYGTTRNAYGPTSNSMRVNDKTILSLQNFVLLKISDEIEHSESEFYYPGELSDAELLQSPTHSESTERKSTLLTTEELHNFLRSQQQANRRSRKQLFGRNCPIINLRNKQTVLRRNFFPWKASRIHRGSKARKPATRRKQSTI